MGTCYLTDPLLTEEAEQAARTYLDEDPAEYSAPPAARRASTFQTAGGGLVVQDFGAPAVDRSISARCEYLTAATVAALQTKYETAGKSWRWVDFTGASFRVFFEAFEPALLAGYADLYQASLRFRVLAVE